MGDGCSPTCATEAASDFRSTPLVAVPHQERLFYVGPERALFDIAREQGNWSWDVPGQPNGMPLNTSPAALFVDQGGGQQLIRLFMGTVDGALHEWTWDDALQTGGWIGHGTPPGTRVATAPGALVYDSQNGLYTARLFVGTEDGRLFERHWHVPSQQWEWADHGLAQGEPVTTAPGALIFDPQAPQPVRFFMGVSGGLIERSWDSPTQQWQWEFLGGW